MNDYDSAAAVEQAVQTLTDRLNRSRNDFGVPTAVKQTWLTLINRLGQSKYYPMYRKIWVTAQVDADTQIDFWHENYHVILGNLSSGDMVYAFWRMLRVLNIYVDMVKMKYMPKDKGRNKNVLSWDMEFAKHDDYVALGDLYLDILCLFKKVFKLTTFAQEGAATYVSLHAPQASEEINQDVEKRREEMKVKLADYPPYRFAKQIAEKWGIDEYGVQDTAEMVLDFPYFPVDMLNCSKEALHVILSVHDSEARWNKLLKVDDFVLKLIYHAFEDDNMRIVSLLADEVLRHLPIKISFDQWLATQFFENPRVLQVLNDCGLDVTSADLQRYYNSDGVLDLFRDIKTYEISGGLTHAWNHQPSYENCISLDELCEIQYIRARAAQFQYVKWFWKEFQGGNEMNHFINFVGKRKHLERIQKVAIRKKLHFVLPLDTDVDDLDSFFSPEMIVQIIIAIAGSQAIASVIIEAIKANHKNISVKTDETGKITEINVSNATDADIDRILEYIDKGHISV